MATSEPFTEEEQLLIETISDLAVPLALEFSDLAFSDPMQPPYCAQLLHGVWLRTFASEDESALPAAFAFIVAGRTEAEMDRLIDGLSQCRCLPVNSDDQLESAWIGAFHDYGEEALTEATAAGQFPMSTPFTHFHMLMKIISVRVLQILNKINPVKLAKLKEQKEWPASLDDIVLPSVGPQTTVKSLEQWARRMSIDHPWPIELLGTIARICRALIIPAILQSPTMIPTILRIAHQICDDAARQLLPRSSKAELTKVTEQLLWRLRFITAFFRNTFFAAGGSPDTIDKYPIERKTAIVQMCGRVIDVLRLPLVAQHAPKEERIGMIKDFTADLALFLEEGVPIEGIPPDILHDAIDRVDRFHGPPLTLISALLIGWKKSLRCYAQGCDKSLQTSSPETFQRCSSCRIVSYCGKECQRRAWRDHKPLCGTISKIIRDGGGDIYSEEFDRSCEAGKVDAGDAAQVVGAYSVWRRTHGSISL
ncbi:MYND finger domain containing protein [Mycena sanguinolenta]|uniref:MYND finger domain containing protein n=1 Tax=Mycena sanguinolenta TaxID=230812 RepID=A0A8H7DIE3_9AGAR|nr:MYND finger domain containing protein [Mycena sanguinolenta]